MKTIARVSILVALAAIGFAFGLPSKRTHAAATSPSTIELWGVTRADRVRIDGAAVTVHGGEIFAGDPMAPSPPVRWPVAEGSHVVELERGACAVQRFDVEVHGALPTTIVIAPVVESRCAVPGPLPRRLP
ncbi:MAG: hypothetical protein ACHREM_10645 [Polyangiales bacterium]